MDRNNDERRYNRDGRDRSHPQNTSSGTNSGRGGGRGRGRPGRGRGHGQTNAEPHQNAQMTRQNVTAPFQVQQQPMGGFNTPQSFAQGQPFGFGGGFAPPQQQTLGPFSGQQQSPLNQPFGGFGAYPPPNNQQGPWGVNQTGFAPQISFGASWPHNTTNVPTLTNSIQSGPAAMDVDDGPPVTTRETPAKRNERRGRDRREDYNLPSTSRDDQASQRRPQDHGRDPRDRNPSPRPLVERKREPSTKNKGKQRAKDDDLVSPEIRAAHRRHEYIFAALHAEKIEPTLATAVMDDPGAQIVVGQLVDTIEDLRRSIDKLQERNQALTGQLVINTRKRSVRSPSAGAENDNSRTSEVANIDAKRQRRRSPQRERSRSYSIASTRDQAPLVVDGPSEPQEEKKSSRKEEITVTMPGPVPPSPIKKEPNPPNDNESAPSDFEDECSDYGVDEVSSDEDMPVEKESEHQRGERMVRNEQRATKRKEIKESEVNRLARLPGPIPNAVGVFVRGNQTERDNSFAGALSSLVYHSKYSNIVFAGTMAVEAATHELKNPSRPYEPMRASKLYKKAPRGFPMNQREVERLFALVKNEYVSIEDRIEGLLLVEEFYRVSRLFIDTQRDRAMELVATNPKFHPHQLPSLAEENPHKLPTQPIPRDRTFRTAGRTSQTKGMGLPAPSVDDTFNLLVWARYIAIYHHPGNGKPIHGIAINYAYQVELRSVFGYLLMRSMCPITPLARTAWTRQVACVVARPQAYREAVMVWEDQHPDERFSEVNPTSITLRRADLTESAAANASAETVFETMIRNRIPPSWVDHAYVWGMMYVNQLRAGGSLNDYLLTATDMDRQNRLALHGVPPPIAQWDGWYYPTAQDLMRITAFVKADELNHPDWLWIGESPLEPYDQRRHDIIITTQSPPAAAGSSTGPGTMENAPSSDHNRDGDRVLTNVYTGERTRYNNLVPSNQPEQHTSADVDMIERATTPQAL